MATFTTRANLKKPDPAEFINVVDLDDNFDKIDNGLGALLCTSTTRPASPFSGQLIWQTDTKSGFVWNGSAWVPSAVSGPIQLTDAATIVVDGTKGNHFFVTLGGNRTLGNPTGLVDGQPLLFEFIQDATGSRTLAYSSMFAFGTDVPSAVLTTTANKRDFLQGVYRSSTNKIYALRFSRGY